MKDDDEITQGQESNDSGTGGHPAWQSILDAVPAEFHDKLTPQLQEWDNGVNNRFQSLHSQYEPWQEIIDQADPESAMQALGLLQMINENPQQVYETLGKAYGFATSGQGMMGQPGASDEEEFESSGDYTENPALLQRISQLEGMLETFTTTQQQFNQQQEEQQLANQFNDWLSQQHETHGEFDDLVVTTLMANGMGGEQAIAHYQNIVKSAAEQQVRPARQAPVVLGNNGGGGLPSSAINPGKMSNNEVQDLVIQMLQADSQS